MSEYFWKERDSMLIPLHTVPALRLELLELEAGASVGAGAEAGGETSLQVPVVVAVAVAEPYEQMQHEE